MRLVVMCNCGTFVIDPEGTLDQIEGLKCLDCDQLAVVVPTCPTPCDADCVAPCHEGHQVVWKREHQPKDCPSGER